MPAHSYSHMSYFHFRLFTGGLCCLLFTALFAGCATNIQSGHQQAPDANFARRATFRFLPDKSQEASEAVSNTAYWRGEIGQDILTAMNWISPCATLASTSVENVMRPAARERAMISRRPGS